MSRSRKKPIYKDVGSEKKIYWRKIRRVVNSAIKNGKEILPIPKEIINDYNYSDYKFDLRFGHNYFKFMDERYKEWVEKTKRK